MGTDGHDGTRMDGLDDNRGGRRQGEQRHGQTEGTGNNGNGRPRESGRRGRATGSDGWGTGNNGLLATAGQIVVGRAATGTARMTTGDGIGDGTEQMNDERRVNDQN